MARIVYSLSGEGRGHATRAETIISMLQSQHDVLVYVPPLAYELLSERFADVASVSLRRLECLRFHYRSGRLSYVSSVIAATPFLTRFPGAITRISREVKDWGATHVVTDFEPLLPRVAHHLHLPLISLDHQHFLSTLDPSLLPRELEWKVRLLRPSIRMFCPRPDAHIVSSYFDYPVRRVAARVSKVGVLLRTAVRSARPEAGDHVVAYLRREMTPAFRRCLIACGRQVLVFGLGVAAPDHNLRFLPTSSHAFIEALRSCTALVCSSGNQLIGEAIHLQKPVLAVPEVGNFEQQINGFFLSRSGGGLAVPNEHLHRQSVTQFLERRAEFAGARHVVASGNTLAMQRLNQWLNGGECRETSFSTPAVVHAA